SLLHPPLAHVDGARRAAGRQTGDLLVRPTRRGARGENWDVPIALRLGRVNLRVEIARSMRIFEPRRERGRAPEERSDRDDPRDAKRAPHRHDHTVCRRASVRNMPSSFMSCSKRPDWTTWPRCRTTILSAWRMVLSRWAMTMRVTRSRSRLSLTAACVTLSSALV